MNIGSFLKKERKKISLSVGEVSRALKTKKSLIEALENNDFHSLPARVYLRGLVKKYCEFLNIPSKKVLRELDETYGESVNPLPKSAKQYKITKVRGFCLADAKKWIALIIFLAIFFYVILRAEDVFGRPRIDIEYPTDNLIITDDEVLVSGSVEGVFKNFSINGQRTNVSEEGSFKEKISLKDGINEITFSAINLFGRQAEKSIKIINQK